MSEKVIKLGVVGLGRGMSVARDSSSFGKGEKSGCPVPV